MGIRHKVGGSRGSRVKVMVGQVMNRKCDYASQALGGALFSFIREVV